MQLPGKKDREGKMIKKYTFLNKLHRFFLSKLACFIV